MGKRKKPYQPKPFESDGRAGDTSANIYVSMLVSPAWKGLSNGAKLLYVYCKAQYYAEKEKPLPRYETLTESERVRCFTMPKEKWATLYELYGSPNTFLRDMEQLLKGGFIELVENGKTTRTKNVYMLSERWRNKPP